MKATLEKIISHLLIDETQTLTQVFKQMDAVDRKLLLVVDAANRYKSLLSVGDIQRHLIKNQNFNEPVVEVLRDTLRVADTSISKRKLKLKC